MEGRPRFSVAIPWRRYQVGEYVATILRDVESEDGRAYRYILAMVMEGSREPKLYITLERNRDPVKAGGSHSMRIVGHQLDETLGSSDQWDEILAFAGSAMGVAMKALGLTDEIPAPLSE